MILTYCKHKLLTLFIKYTLVLCKYSTYILSMSLCSLQTQSNTNASCLLNPRLLFLRDCSLLSLHSSLLTYYCIDPAVVIGAHFYIGITIKLVSNLASPFINVSSFVSLSYITRQFFLSILFIQLNLL